ncbi:hypothetical protein THAOC_25911, partial [Thalassiosira oceanica]
GYGAVDRKPASPRRSNPINGVPVKRIPAAGTAGRWVERPERRKLPTQPKTGRQTDCPRPCPCDLLDPSSHEIPGHDRDLYLGNPDVRRDRRSPRPVIRPDQVLPRPTPSALADPDLPGLKRTDKPRRGDPHEQEVHNGGADTLHWGIVVLATLMVLLVIIFGYNDLGIAPAGMSIFGDKELGINPAGKGSVAAAFVFLGLACGLQYLLMTHWSLRHASHERAGFQQRSGTDIGVDTDGMPLYGMHLEDFKNRITESFDILWQRREIRWPFSSGGDPPAGTEDRLLIEDYDLS